MEELCNKWLEAVAEMDDAGLMVSLSFTLLPYPFPKQALVFTRLQYKPFENTVGKGEIARNEQFLLFLQCFLTILGAFCHFHQI